jgi:hypothetical protein
VVPAITPAEAAELVRTADALIVEVRDQTEVKASGKAKGAVAVSRGPLESRADRGAPTIAVAGARDASNSRFGRAVRPFNVMAGLVPAMTMWQPDGPK